MKSQSITFSVFLLLVLLFSCTNRIEQKKEIIGKEINYVYPYTSKLIYDTIYYYFKGKMLYEYQSNLSNLFSKIKDTDSIAVREMSFYGKNNKKSYVWLIKEDTKWIIIDNVFFDYRKIKF